MKILIFTASIFLMIGCKSNANNDKSPTKMEINFQANYYKEISDTIHFVRIVKESVGLRRIDGEVSHTADYNTLQKITLDTIIKSSDLDKLIGELLTNGYRDVFDNYAKIMFVQIQSMQGSNMGFLDKRHSLEQKIERVLIKNKLGDWVAGDLGPGGANMLFEVNDWDKAFALTIDLLKHENLNGHCIITRRLYTASDDWNYEIVYPIDFDGIFNQM